MNKESGIAELRGRYHREICRQILGLRSGTLSNADRTSHTSQSLANGHSRFWSSLDTLYVRTRQEDRRQARYSPT